VRGIVFDQLGENIFINNSNSIVRVNLNTKDVTLWAGNSGSGGTIDGTTTNARLNTPCGLEIDSAGIIYVAEQNGDCIRVITPGLIPSNNNTTTLAGNFTLNNSSQDGCGNNALFDGPTGIVRTNLTDIALRDRGDGDRLYICESNRNIISKVIISTGCKTTIAGDGTIGSIDGVGAAAQFNQPNGIAISPDGLDLYVADLNNHTIRSISLRDVDYGAVTTIAGTATTPGSTDGDGLNALFRGPIDVAVDATGNIYVTDWIGGIIRRISGASRTVTTIAGLAGTSGATDGIGSAARFTRPRSIQVDPSNTYLYIADQITNSRIRILDLATNKVITLLA
jgi:DNA-binding beta-propeller fold protein YncE